MPLLELRNIHSAYGNVKALRGISLSVDEGEIVTLLGANGAGKSTTLRSISRLASVTEGEILFDGKPLAQVKPEHIVRMGIAHVPEGRRIFPGLTVRENIMIGASARGRLPRAAMASEIEAMFAIFPDLRRLSDAYGWSLSGGQQQMLAVARGLMSRPRLLLLDEPSLGLAPIIVQQLFATIRAIRERGATILLVEQNAHMALSVADRGYVLSTGQLIVEGTAMKLAVEALYDTYSIADFAVASSPEAAAYEKKYKEKYKLDADLYSAWAYDAVNLLAMAINNAKSTKPDDIKQALHAIKDYKGVEGTYQFDKNGDGLHGYNIVRNEKGKVVFIKHIDFKPEN